MGSNLGIALLLGLVGAFAIYDYAIGTNYIFRPLVTGVLVGIVMGDVRQGTIIGASLELMFMGAVSVGAKRMHLHGFRNMPRNMQADS